MRVLAIDPGTNKSGVVIYNTETREVHLKATVLNMGLKIAIEHKSMKFDHVAIEMIAGYGMQVGKDTFETVIWIGRFIERCEMMSIPIDKVYRKDVKLCLLHKTRGTDSLIRKAIIDLYPKEGGGSVPQIGTKAKPGPLYGITDHMWQALAVALTWAENNGHCIIEQPRPF